MPKTKIQKFIFGMMMALVMVYGMEVYNGSLRSGGLSAEVFAIPLGELAGMSLVVILLETVIAGPLARKLAFRIVDVQKRGELAGILAVSVATVCLMCPMMSLTVTLIFQGFSRAVPAIWLHTLAFNLPMAFCWQLLIAGPAVRFAFRNMFRKQLARTGQELL